MKIQAFATAVFLLMISSAYAVDAGKYAVDPDSCQGEVDRVGAGDEPYPGANEGWGTYIRELDVTRNSEGIAVFSWLSATDSTRYTTWEATSARTVEVTTDIEENDGVVSGSVKYRSNSEHGPGKRVNKINIENGAKGALVYDASLRVYGNLGPILTPGTLYQVHCVFKRL